MRVILASQSPRRKDLMDLLNIKYEVIPSKVKETIKEDQSIIEQVMELAYIKAKEVFNMASGDRIVIGADTIVLKNDKVYGKPKNQADAKKMIKELKNDVHDVITSICILIQDGEKFKKYIDYDLTKVYLKDISEDEIEKWIKTGEALDKAAGYAIQGEFGIYVKRIEGNYNSVVGLPIHKIYDIIKKYL